MFSSTHEMHEIERRQTLEAVESSVLGEHKKNSSLTRTTKNSEQRYEADNHRFPEAPQAGLVEGQSAAAPHLANDTVT